MTGNGGRMDGCDEELGLLLLEEEEAEEGEAADKEVRIIGEENLVRR